MATITVNGITLDPDTPPPGLASALESADVSQSNHIMVQTDAPLTPEQEAELRDAGAEILEVVPQETYICRFEPADLEPVRALPFVVWAGPYLRGFKIAPALLTPEGDAQLANMSDVGLETTMSQEPRDVLVVLHRDADPEAERAELAEAVRANPEDLQIAGRKLMVRVRPQVLERLAALDAVRHVEEAVVNKLHNTVALRIIGADRVHAGPARLTGEGQIVAVCDTGFDKGSTSNTHPAFTGRVRKLFALGRSKANDPDGHGTHVAGSVLGAGQSATMGGPVTGAAPRAELVLQSVLDAAGGLGGLPGDLKTLFAQAYAEGARIHTNSWGAAVSGAYTANSEEVDEYVWNQRDMTILFSAGNEGVDRNGNGVIDNGSIGSPGTAKNCITIGASESDRPAISKAWGAVWTSRYPANPVRDDLWADNPEGLAAFSSRGPTRDQRIKPDLVAPGTAILSAHSRDANVGSFWGPSSDPAYCFMGGTSMATPIAAGCAALVRQFLGGQPSAALVKATLINGAADIRGQYTPPDAGPTPNYAEGFGRVDMPNTVGPFPAGVQVDHIEEGQALRTGQSWTHQVTLPRAGRLKATLVWTDAPGENLQNDLDLIVRGPGGVERHGNVAPGSMAFDRHNNVEQVHWLEAPAGTYDIVVRAHRALGGGQTFALVVRTA